MTAKNRVLRLFKVMALLLISSTPLLGQNMLTNGGFESGTNGFHSDYEYQAPQYNGSNVGILAGKYTIDNNSNGHGIGSLGWPTNLYGHGGSGKYMLVNGWGGNDAPGKHVWKQQVDVISHVYYVFSCYVRNLSRSLPPIVNANPSIIRISINGNPIATDVTLDISNHDWELITIPWNSQNASGQVSIEIIDAYTGESDRGDDFGLDDIEFKLADGYSLTAIDDTITFCGEVTPIQLIQGEHYTMSFPSGGNSAPSMQVRIRKNNNDPWTTELINTFHGTAYVGNDNRIYYTPNTGYHGRDYVRFQVSRFGLDDAGLITINVLDVPSNCSPQGLPADGTLCLDAVSSFNPTATWSSNGSPLSLNDWEFKKNGVTDWEPSGDFQSYIQNTGGTGEYSIRFLAANECDTAASDEYQIEVIDKPTVESIGDITVCAPASFSLEAPGIDYHGSDPTATPGWQIQIGGQWVNVPNTIEYEHNGCSIRYYAENGCGSNYSDTVQLVVNAAPIVGPITAPEGICAGESFGLVTPQSIVWRHNDPTTCWGGWEIQIDGVWDSLVNHTIPFDYNGCLIRYKAVNGCDTTYSTNNVQVTVYSREPVYEGEITACDPIYHHGHLCDTTGLYIVNDSITPNGCQIQVSWHFTLGEAYIAPIQYVDTCDFYYWPKTHRTYYETNVYDTIISSPQFCDSTFTLDLTINHAPTIQGEIQMNDICVGDLLAVTGPEPEYNHSGGGHHQWEFAESPDGPFQAFDPETYQLEFGSYFIRFAVFNGCDSTYTDPVPLHVNDQPVISGQLSPQQVCVGNPLVLPEVSVDWRNASQTGDARWQMAEEPEGPYAQFDSLTPMQIEHNGHWVRFMARNECDTVYLGPVQVTVIDEQDVTVEHDPECDSVLFAGVYYTMDTIIDEVIEEPCPYTVHHELVVNHRDSTEVERMTCHEYFDWHGYHFEHSDGTQYGVFDTINRFGCDSIVVLKLDFGPYDMINLDDEIACNSFWWDMKPDTIYYYDENEITHRDSVFVPASDPDDCPTWYYLNMTIGRSYDDVEGEPLPRCRGFVWHGVPCYADTLVYDSLLTRITHCDSIVSHQITIIQPVDTLVDMVSCEPTMWHTHLFFEDEIFTDTLQSTVTGCDSIVTINFRLDDYYNEFDTVACEPFEWYNQLCHDYLNVMEISHVFESVQGCDSTVIKHVRLNHVVDYTNYKLACAPYLFPFNGVLYEEPGVYIIDTATIANQYGCDSIVYHVRLEIRDSEQIGLISGSSNVFVASSLISGIYRYEVDPNEVIGNITWSLSDTEWQIIEANQNYCLVFVTTPGLVTLSARFRTSECGVIERSFEINAGFYGVDDKEAVVANVYPNPTEGIVTVEAEGIESIRLSNMMGQMLDWREYDRSNSVSLNLNGFAPSVYLLEIKTVNGMVKRRVMVSR